jgi:hypothetical protein
MVTGSDRILRTLEEEFQEMLRRLMHNRSRPARVIVLEGEATGFLQIERAHPDMLRVFHGSSVRPLNHFFVSDADTAREEAIHSPLQDDMPEGYLPAQYYPNNRAKAQTLHTKFEGYWKGATGESEPPPPPTLPQRLLKRFRGGD